MKQDKCPFCRATARQKTESTSAAKFLCGTIEHGDMPDRWIRSPLCDALQLLDELNAAIKVKDEALKAAKKLALQHEEISADYVLMEIEEALAAGRSKT